LGDAHKADSDKTAAGADLEITLPEGVEVDKGVLDAFRPVAAELGLDSEKASKLAGWYAEQQQQAQAAAADASKQLAAQWVDSIKSDPDFGGQKFEATIANAKRGLVMGGSPALTALLEQTGLGNHPEIIKFAARFGAGLSEDNTDAPSAPAGTRPASREAALQHRYRNSDYANVPE